MITTLNILQYSSVGDIDIDTFLGMYGNSVVEYFKYIDRERRKIENFFNLYLFKFKIKILIIHKLLLNVKYLFVFKNIFY